MSIETWPKRWLLSCSLESQGTLLMFEISLYCYKPLSQTWILCLVSHILPKIILCSQIILYCAQTDQIKSSQFIIEIADFSQTAPTSWRLRKTWSHNVSFAIFSARPPTVWGQSSYTSCTTPNEELVLLSDPCFFTGCRADGTGGMNPGS